jgi:zinc protease
MKKILIALTLIGLTALLIGGLYLYQRPIGRLSAKEDQPVPSTETLILKSPLSIHHWKTKKGTPVYFVPTDTLPMVDIVINFEAGSARDGEKPGLASLLSTLLVEGTEEKSAKTIAKTFENVGAVFGTYTDRDKLSINLRSLADTTILSPVVDQLSEIISKPAFLESSIEQVKNQTLVLLKKALRQPSMIAVTALYKGMYEKHPYGHLVSGTIDSVSTLTREDLSKFHTHYFVANNATITLVGGISYDHAKKIAERLTHSLPEGKAAEPMIDIPLPKKNENHIHFPSQQSHVLLGQPCCSVNDPDYFPLLIGNYILGEGSLTARIFKEIREKRGLAYSAGSRINYLKKEGPFIFSVQTKSNQAQEVVKLLKENLQTYRESGPTEEELIAAKKGLKGAFPLSMSSNANIADLISEMTFYNQPLDFLIHYQANIDNVTRADIQTAFKRRINPDTMSLITVGE